MRTHCQTITLTRINGEPWRAFVMASPGTTRWIQGSGDTPQSALASLWADEETVMPVPATPLSLPHPSFRGERLTVRETIQLACAFVGLDFIDLAGPGRHAAVVARRRMVWHLVYTRGDGLRQIFSWPEIAVACGKRTHSSLITSTAQVKPLLGSPDLNETEQQWAQVMTTRTTIKPGPGCERILSLWSGRAHQSRVRSAGRSSP